MGFASGCAERAETVRSRTAESRYPSSMVQFRASPPPPLRPSHRYCLLTSVTELEHQPSYRHLPVDRLNEDLSWNEKTRCPNPYVRVGLLPSRHWSSTSAI